MARWYTEAGKAVYGSTDGGIYVDGPLTVEDWKKVLEMAVEELVEQAKREAEEAKR